MFLCFVLLGNVKPN